MKRLEKVKLAIEKGYTCDPTTGKVYNRFGKELNKRLKDYIIIGSLNLLAHQFIYYWVHKKIVEQIDHINGIKNDNRIENLREVTNQQNQFNRKEVKGYSWCKRTNKWLSSIYINGKNKSLGYFSTTQEARQAYLDAKKIYHII